MTAPRVFISYSHESAEHRHRVLALANRLRSHGIDCRIDQYVDAPAEGWPTWMARQIETADFVLVVCTAEYRRRFQPEHDQGQGSRFEMVLLVQELHDARMVNDRLVPVLLTGATSEDIPKPLRAYSRYAVETEGGYEALLRHLLERPKVVRPALGEPPELAPEPTTVVPFVPTSDRPFAVDPRVYRTFVGREEELAHLRQHLIDEQPAAPLAICAIDGMGGVGKSYLADRFAWEHRAAFPGGYVRLVLDPLEPQEPAASFNDLAQQLGLPEGPDLTLRVRHALRAPCTLLHVENVDSDAAYRSTADVLEGLGECTVIVSGRIARLGKSRGWARVDLGPFSKPKALDQLRDEFEAPILSSLDEVEQDRLVEALGRLPLAIHLAAGHLDAGRTVDSFLARLRQSGLSLEPADGADGVGRTQGRRILSEVFGLSIELLEQHLGRRAGTLLAGFHALAHAPPSGFGRSLGAALAGLGAEDFEDLVLAAVKLSLLLEVPTSRHPEGAWRVHPLVAELERHHLPDPEPVVARATRWFVDRLPEQSSGGEHLQGVAWGEIHAERRALAWWLERVPPAEWSRVVRAGSWMAMTSGPHHPWMAFCQRCLGEPLDAETRSTVLWTLARTAERVGALELAWSVAHQQAAFGSERNADRDVALARGVVADILQARGQLDEALRIREKEQLPVFRRLEDVREVAVTQRQIAEILLAQGDPDEALRIHRDEELPVFEALGDIRERAITQGRIADALQARGQLDEALRLRETETIPIFEKVGDVRELVIARTNLGLLYLARDRTEDEGRAIGLLRDALVDAERLRIPEAEEIASLLEALGNPEPHPA